ncbi:MAG TPA: phosphoribosylformylglycinamidine synthase subunit PurL [Candidatus Dormibacteraeota bacterium]|jgi:phosphoribosylformylglycinamidine synthase II|nr:phosphoribosylformylglycinamidine synthase subunit PurL [Candidatus Dormibacteraeota bacterium]
MATSTTPAFVPETLRQHGLTTDEYEKIKQLLGNREPTLTELGIFSVMWSEHCSYKSSRVHLKRLPTRSKRVLQGPGENAGIIDIGDGWACAFKIESHNHPSFIEPFQGATTGVGGILRDIFTMGARPVAVMDSLRFGPITKHVAPDAFVRGQKDSVGGRTNASAATQAEIHRNHSILEGVVSGVASYGNCFGVPNLGGETKFEACYSGNPLVNAFAMGLVRKDEIFYARAAGEGNPVIYVGAKTGRDGIHGATMASEEFSEASEAKRPNVQVGDPFLEKLLLEACLEAMKTGAIVGIQDMGAAGLTCSTCEMGGRGGVGIEIELDRVPQRETGMSAYEIMLSESQERMLLVALKGREQEVFRVFEKWGLDAVEVGKVTTDNKLRVLHHGEVVAEIPNQALTDDAPVYKRPLARWEPPVSREMPAHIQLNGVEDLAQILKQLLASPNICGKRWVWQQYDHMVQTNTVEAPGAGDAGVIRIKNPNPGAPQRGLAMALDGNSRWCYLDPRLGAMHAVAEAARKVACSGATPVGATNCLNFGNPEKPHIMWQFSQTIDGITKACEELEIPITGGNVSFYNETLGEGIYPTPVLGVVGTLDDVHKTAKMHFASPGRAIAMLRAGEEADISDVESEFGSSEYAKEILGVLWGYPPELNLEKEVELQKAVIELIQQSLVDSAHDCSEGGIAVALAEKAFAKGVGARVNLASNGLPAEFVLFGEDASRIVVSCDPGNVERIKQVAEKHGIVADLLGETIPERLEISLDGRVVVSAAVSELNRVYETALESSLRTDPELVTAD